MVTQRQIPLPLPRLRQFRFLETQILEHAERRGLQLRDLLGIRHVGDFLLEEIVLAPGKFRELLHALLGLTLLRQHQLLCDLGNFLLLHVPQRVARPVFARQAFDIRQGFDIGELARLLLLQGLEKLRQRTFVLLPCLFRLRALGLEGLALLGGFLLTTAEVALP